MISLKFNELIEQISSKIRINEIPREIRTIYRVNFKEPEELAKDIFKYLGYFTENEKKEQLNFRSYFDQNSHLFQSIELDELIDILLSDQNYYEKIKEYENIEEKIIEIIKNFIIELYQKEQKITFNENELKNYVNELETYFRGNEVIIISRHPLDGFYSNVEKIELEKGLSIQQIPLNEREELFSGHFLYSFNRNNILVNEYWLINEYLYKDRYINDYAIFIEKEFLKFLRIFKSGTIGMHQYQLKSKYWDPEYISIGGFISSSDTFVLDHGNYIIQEEEAQKFADLWRKYREIDLLRDRALNTAINRYNDYFTRKEVEDRLIDLMIAFEAIFLRETEKMELTFKLALRTAVFLEGKDIKRENLFEFIKRAYDVRSSIIHGSKTKDKIKVKKSLGAKESDEYTLHEFLNKL
ncbi:MAG: hypothetical protein FFODKBPE_00423 [Candidatus Argoarchaeum ethanivorans]|uniref:Apea-like HEPN domain-containing protein n=1 Tax=Candidatus Argoarchaeum ethanivorans TaxID=2608793 RepID=A0A811TBJ8_9EURY|nr:MAG: hypothetical protein FFODKBPE_00423 [Candidatus Argoarchaeum ethanivorans]